MTYYITGCDSIVKHVAILWQAIGKQQNYTCIGWVHRCMDWVQMNPRAPPGDTTDSLIHWQNIMHASTCSYSHHLCHSTITFHCIQLKLETPLTIMIMYSS